MTTEESTTVAAAPPIDSDPHWKRDNRKPHHSSVFITVFTHPPLVHICEIVALPPAANVLNHEIKIQQTPASA